MMMKGLFCALCLLAVLTASARGGDRKVVYSSSDGLEGKSLDVLTEGMGKYLLREGHSSIYFCFAA